MGKLFDKLRHKAEQYWEEDEMKARITHSTSYHTFFQGYTERRMTDSEGRGYRIDRVYTAHYLACTDSKKSWLLTKLAYGSLYLFAGVFGTVGIVRMSGYYFSWYVVIPLVLEIFAYLLLLVPVINFLSAPMKMTLGMHKTSSAGLIKFGGIAAVMSAVTCAAMAVFFLLHVGEVDGRALSGMILQIAFVSFLFVLRNTEKGKKYERIENENSAPNNSNEIW